MCTVQMASSQRIVGRVTEKQLIEMLSEQSAVQTKKITVSGNKAGDRILGVCE